MFKARKRTGVLWGIFLGGFVDGIGLDQVLHFGQVSYCLYFTSRCVRDAGMGFSGSSFPFFLGTRLFPFVPGDKVVSPLFLVAAPVTKEGGSLFV